MGARDVGAVIAIPSLAEVVADASRAKGLTRPALGALLIELAAVQTQLSAEVATASDAPAVAPPDRSLTIEQAADRVHVAPATMKRWLRREPFNAAVVVRSRTMVRVSAAMLEQVIQGGAAVRQRRRQIMARAGSGA